jgi:hypothetical protein
MFYSFKIWRQFKNGVCEKKPVLLLDIELVSLQGF